MKIAGAVILYHPEQSIKHNIQTYLPHLSRLFVLDNSEIPSDFLMPLFVDEKIHYIHDGENKGISARLNLAAEKAAAEGYDWLLTMDQDSFFRHNECSKYLHCINGYSEADKVAMFGVQYTNADTSSECAAQNINYLITSGSVVNLNIFQLIGGFDENLFIDEVDLEYCYRARASGFQIVQFTNIFLQHELGKNISGISLKSFRQTPRTVHVPLRVYYMVRNYFYVNQKYPQLYPSDNPQRKGALLNRIKNNLLYGKQKLLLLKMIIRGIRDFKAKRMGKYRS